ncbi:hypothetical protein ACPCG0_01395 [Propionibacteriaceae bacterium Y1923]|uniref:hypothetical protein n=1 Tax=Aestuariimicrobium sp. Y1814 TaxID=3418742 RepID=UPI003C27B5D1
MNDEATRKLAAILAELDEMESPPPAPAPDEDIAAAQDWFQQHYPGTLPTDLVDFWRRFNGLGYDGVVIYAARSTQDWLDDVEGINQLYVDDQPDHFLVGQSDDVYFYAWRPSSQVYERLGVGDFDGEVETFTTFEDLFNLVFGERLD